MVTVQREDIAYLLFIGDHEEVERFLDAHRGLKAVVSQSDRRIQFAREQEFSSAQPIRLQASITMEEDIALLSKVPDLRLSEIVDKSCDQALLNSLNGYSSEQEIEDVLLRVQVNYGAGVANLLLSMILELQQGRPAAALGLLEKFRGTSQEASVLPAAQEAAALDSIENSDSVARVTSKNLDLVEATFESPDFQEWLLYLHPRQRSLVERDFDRPCLLAGVSGSGKTVVMLHRAKMLAAKYAHEKIAILTLNSALAALIRELLAKLVPVEPRIEVMSVFQYFKKVAETVSAAHYIRHLEEASDTERGGLRRFSGFMNEIHVDRTAMEANFNRSTLDDFWADFWETPTILDDRLIVEAAIGKRAGDIPAYVREEIELIRSTYLLTEREDYLEAERRGRSIPLARGEGPRSALLRIVSEWELFTLCNRMADEMALTQAILLEQPRWQHLTEAIRSRCILVDEFQDLSTMDLNLLMALRHGSSNDLLLAGDQAQQVFVKDLDLRKAGLARTDRRTVTLRLNYRNTIEILEFAGKVIEGVRN